MTDTWKQKNDAIGDARKVITGRTETDIERYNATQMTNDAFSRNRIAADHLREVQRLQRDLKEVWE